MKFRHRQIITENEELDVCTIDSNNRRLLHSECKSCSSANFMLKFN